MTLRVPIEVRRAMDRLATQWGHKPAQVGARLIEEALRRRQFPQIELRDTVAGRVAYIQGTRLAVYWVAENVRRGTDPESFAGEYKIPAARVYAALAYAEAFPKEMADDREKAEANRSWVEAEDAASTIAHPGKNAGKQVLKRRR